MRKLATLLALIFFSLPAQAQPCTGQIASGQVCGNSSPVQRTPFPTTLGAIAATGNAGIRELLAAPRTYYVNPNSGGTANCNGSTGQAGSNSNSGLALSAPLLTLQAAYNKITNSLDLGGQTVTVQMCDGTYSTGVSFVSIWSGGGQLRFQGNTTTTDNVHVSGSSNLFILNGPSLPGPVTLKNFKLTTSGGTAQLYIGSPGQFLIDTMNFGAATGGALHILASTAGALAYFVGPVRITGDACVHAYAQSGGMIFNRAVAYTLGPTRLRWTCDNGATLNGMGVFAEGLGYVDAHQNTYVGAQAVAFTLASPAVATWGGGSPTAHGLSINDAVVFNNTGGGLPTGLTAGQTYFVTATPSSSTFRFSASVGGPDVNTSAPQSGTHNVFAAQGPRYNCRSGGAINVVGAGATYLPGSTLPVSCTLF